MSSLWRRVYRAVSLAVTPSVRDSADAVDELANVEVDQQGETKFGGLEVRDYLRGEERVESVRRFDLEDDRIFDQKVEAPLANLFIAVVDAERDLSRVSNAHHFEFQFQCVLVSDLGVTGTERFVDGDGRTQYCIGYAPQPVIRFLVFIQFPIFSHLSSSLCVLCVLRGGASRLQSCGLGGRTGGWKKRTPLDLVLRR